MLGKFKNLLKDLQNKYKNKNYKFSNLRLISKILNTKDLYDNKYNDYIDIINMIKQYIIIDLNTIVQFKNINLFTEISNGNIQLFTNIFIPEKYQYIYNDEGNTLLHHCIINNDISIFKLLYNNYNYPINLINKDKKSLTIYCLLNKELDIYEYIKLNHTIPKNWYVLKNNINHNYNYIDIPIIINILINQTTKETFNIPNINMNELIGFNNYTFNDLFNFIKIKLKSNYNEYIKIINEELEYYIENYSCYNSKLEIILYNVIPFIDYSIIDENKIKHNLYISSENILKNELNFILKNKNYKKKINNSYIKKNLYTKNYIYKILNNIIY